MGFWDKIQGLLNPAVIEEYDDLYKNHSLAIDMYIRNRYEPRNIIELPDDIDAFHRHNSNWKEIYDYLYKDWTNKNYETNSVKLSYKQKEYIVKHKNEILDLYKRFIKYSKVERMCEIYFKRHPHAIASLCSKLFNVYLSSVEMPMYSIDEKGNLDATMFCSLMLKKNIKSVSELSFLQKRELLNYEESFLEEEILILKQIEESNIYTDFDNNILKNDSRKKYYEQFLDENGIFNHRLFSSKKYCLDNIVSLDSYISNIQLKKQRRYIIFKDLVEQYESYIIPYIKHKFERNEVESLTDDEINYLIENYSEIIDYIEQEGRKKIDILRKDFPIGMSLFEEEFWKDVTCLGIVPDSIGLVPDSPEWWSERFEARICHINFERYIGITDIDKNRLALLEKNGAEYRKGLEWEKKQKEFAQICRTEHNEYLKGWGANSYDIPFQRTGSNGDIIYGEFPIWHFFGYSFCVFDLDYSLFPHIKANTKALMDFASRRKKIDSAIVSRISNYIEHINKKTGNICVIVIEELSQSQDINTFHLSTLFSVLDNAGITYYRGLNNFLPKSGYKGIFIISISVLTNGVKKVCADFIEKYKNICPTISFISILKGHSKEEMSNLIELKKAEIEKKEQVKDKLTSCVSSWYDIGFSTMKCFSMYNYYPTTCDFEATNEEWYVRNLIWDFKASPHKPIAKEIVESRQNRALDIITPLVERCLKYYFGDYLSKLSIVCIPASSQEKTYRRYLSFTTRLCFATDMDNLSGHLRIKTSGEAKHIGGKIKAEVEIINASDFKGKYILLFDDVITKGDSMLSYKNKLESLGAIVIGGFSIGRTRHERQSNNPIDLLQLPTIYNNDDLPF